MSTALIIAIVVIALAVLGIYALIMARKRQTERLQQQFGPEYDRLVSATRGRAKAERELAERQRRVENMHITDLEPERQQTYSGEWHTVQMHFVDNPGDTIQ